MPLISSTIKLILVMTYVVGKLIYEWEYYSAKGHMSNNEHGFKGI